MSKQEIRQILASGGLSLIAKPKARRVEPRDSNAVRTSGFEGSIAEIRIDGNKPDGISVVEKHVVYHEHR